MSMEPNYIPQANPKAAYLSQKEEIDKTVYDILNKGWYILGKQVSTFEQNFANFIGARYAIGVANGTDAVELCLRVLEIGKNDAVFTVSHTAVATISGIERSGATPVLVDIDQDTYTMDPQSLEEAIQEENRKGLLKPSAIVLVHLYGHPADITAIKSIADKYNLRLIEDCAQAHGAQYNGQTVGTFGDMAAFSFYPTKNLGAFGDGGAVITNNRAFAEKAKALREYGWTERYISTYSGINSRLDELQAAILNVRLKMLGDENEKRRKIADKYNAILKSKNDIIFPKEKSNCKHVYHLYVLRMNQRDAFREYMNQNQIGTAVHYPYPIHLQAAYKNRIQLSPGGLPKTEDISKKIVSLPMYPQLDDIEIDRVLDALDKWDYRGN